MPNKYALVIGNTEYTDSGLAKLNAPGKDAEDFARVLQSVEIGAFDEVVTFVNETVFNLNVAIEDFFADKKPEDLLVFYFSGHGVRDESGSLFLAVKNTNRKRLRATAIKTDFVREMMDQSRSRRQVIILDCCNSGAFDYGAKAETGGSMGMAKAFEGTGYGHVVLTATDATQFAWEGDRIIGDETANSLFTHFLVKGLEGEADEDGDGRISVDELYEYVYKQIVNRTPKQTPGKWSYKQQGEIILRQSSRIENIKPQPLSAELMDEIEDTRPYVREAAVQKLEKILKGRNMGQARSARTALEKIAVDENTTHRVAQLAGQALAALGENDAPIDEEKKAKEEAERLAAQKKEKERKAREKSAADNRARETREKAKKEELARKNAEIYNRSREATMTAVQNFLPKLKIPALILVVAFIGYLLWQNAPSIPVPPAETKTPQATISATFAVAAPTKTITPIPTKTLVSTPVLGIGSTTTAAKDGMILMYVPAGEFTMGSNSGNDDEKPVNTVNVDAFWIDQTEVTNAMYAKCVDVGECVAPSDTSNFNNSSYAKHPVVYVDWNQANAYCSWAERRLPTEAEWEKAARGTDGRTYPWGEGIDCNKANYQSGCVGGTAPVGSYESGKSPYEVYDMAGNVWEWVSSLYRAYPYAVNDGREKLSTIDSRVLRGGSWYYFDSYARSASRNWAVPTDTYVFIGFRCARSLP